MQEEGLGGELAKADQFLESWLHGSHPAVRHLEAVLDRTYLA